MSAVGQKGGQIRAISGVTTKRPDVAAASLGVGGMACTWLRLSRTPSHHRSHTLECCNEGRPGEAWSGSFRRVDQTGTAPNAVLTRSASAWIASRSAGLKRVSVR